MNNKTTLIVTSLLSLTSLVGCGNSTTDGALLGAGIGALAGQAIGGNTEGTLIGAGAGALGGWIIGGEIEKDQMRNRRTREMLELERGVTLRRSETRKVRICTQLYSHIWGIKYDCGTPTGLLQSFP